MQRWMTSFTTVAGLLLMLYLLVTLSSIKQPSVIEIHHHHQQQPYTHPLRSTAKSKSKWLLEDRKSLRAALPTTCPPSHRCIGLGTKLFGSWEMWLTYYKTWTSQFRNCHSGYQKCALISNISNADALIFHARDLFPSDHLPQFHPYPSQFWIFFSWETPANVNNYNLRADVGWRHQFNWSATYKRVSDIETTYGAKVRRPLEIPQKETPIFRLWGESSPFERKKLGFALVSNCRTGIRRLGLLKQLQRHMQLEIFGSCGQRFPYRDRQSAARDFYFYFAFENSRCVDYMTEKFWLNSLAAGVVPVVLGGRREDYRALAPPNSYVFAEDFGSPVQLANFLKQEAADPIRYSKYFEWQKTYALRETDKAEDFFCKLCEKLFSDRKPQRIDLNSIWSATDCKSKPVI